LRVAKKAAWGLPRLSEWLGSHRNFRQCAAIWLSGDLRRLIFRRLRAEYLSQDLSMFRRSDQGSGVRVGCGWPMPPREEPMASRDTLEGGIDRPDGEPSGSQRGSDGLQGGMLAGRILADQEQVSSGLQESYGRLADIGSGRDAPHLQIVAHHDAPKAQFRP
jgi:hypothetical protein